MTRRNLFRSLVAFIFSILALPIITQQGTKQIIPGMLLTMPRVGSYALAPNGKQMIYSVSQPSIKGSNSRTSIYFVNSDGMRRAELTASSADSEHTPRWSQDGKQIYLVRGTDQSMQFFACTLSDGAKRQLTAIDGGIVDYRFSLDEKTLLYAWDIKTCPVITDVHPDLDKAGARITEDLMYKHWDEQVSTMPHLFIVKVAAQPITKGLDLLEGEPYEASVRPHNGTRDTAFSLDGNLIAYARHRKTDLKYNLSTNSDIYLYNVSIGEMTNTSGGIMGYDTNPVFSPDDHSLIWADVERDGYESDLQILYLYNLAKKQYRLLTANFEYNIANPTWGADSKTTYFTTCHEALTHIYSYQLVNDKVKRVTDGQYDYTGFDLGDKGVRVASRQTMTYPTELFMVNLKNGKATVLTVEDKPVMS